MITEKGQRALIFHSFRANGRDKAHIRTMTVRDLMEYLNDYDLDMPVIIEGYDGYQNNGITDDTFWTEVIE